jgi:nitric oxide reductase activation protein
LYLKHAETLSSFAFNFNLRRYNEDDDDSDDSGGDDSDDGMSLGDMQRTHKTKRSYTDHESDLMLAARRLGGDG